MSDILEKEILGAIILHPELLEKLPDISNILDSDKNRLIYKSLKQNFEKSLVIDISLIADDLKEKVPANYIASTLEGLPHSQASLEVVLEKIRRLKVKSKRKELLKKVNEINQQLEKTGSAPDLSEIRKLFDELDALEVKKGESEDAAITVEELGTLQIKEIDWLIRPIVERFGYTLLGAQKGVGKSLLVTQLGLYAASGLSPFLSESIIIPKPVNVLLVQQEVSLAGMKDRLFKMQMEKRFNPGGRFRQLTTTGAWLNLTEMADYQRLVQLIEKYKPDILILDPLYTFYPKELNTSGDISPMMKVLSDLKTNFNLGLVVVHHFSNKEDPDIQRTPVSRFMGHSMIANSADVTIGLDFLHPKYRQASLPLPYQNYIMIEVTTRHGEWPERFALERKRGCLIFERSSIWQDIHRSLIPGQIEDLLEANGGEMLQKQIIGALKKEASQTTVKRALYEAEGRTIEKEALPGKGNPVLWRRIR